MASACSTCDTALLPGAAFCTACGTAAPVSCTACGEALVPGASFCVQCGASQRAAVPPPPPPPPAPPAFSPPTEAYTAPPAEGAGAAPAPVRPGTSPGGPLLSTRVLAIIGGGVAVVLVALVAVLAVRGERDVGAAAESGPRALASPAGTRAAAAAETPAATETAAPVEATPTPAEAPALTDVPSTDAAELAEQVDLAEEILHAPESTASELEAAGRFEQMASRRLNAGGARLRRGALAAMGSDARVTMRATTNAAKAIAVVVEPQKRFPKWRIVSPPSPERLLRYFRSAESRTGVPWEYLAAIEFVETRFGRIEGVSSAGAQGPMQFMPATWARYGSGDVHDQRDAILGAARYLVANGAPGDMATALFHYNPSSGYVRAIREYAERMAQDRRAYFGFYYWQVLYKHVRGTMILPEGYPKARPVPMPVQ